MVEIREYKYKVINKKLYLGIELEAKGQTFFKNSIITIEFQKDGKSVKYDDSFVIPYIAGEGIICLGREYDCDFEFDNIEVMYIIGEFEWETNNLDNVEWSFEGYDEATRKLTYKFINKGKDSLNKASMNLVFFNKGELVCGTSIDKENLLTQREYYFEYIVPNGIEFTEVHPFLALPCTNHLLYKGFLIKYLSTSEEIDNLSQTIPHKEILEFKDKEAQYTNDISKEEDNLKRIKKIKKRSVPYVLFRNVLLVILNIFKSFGTALMAGIDFVMEHTITIILSWLHGVFVFFLIIFLITQWHEIWNDPETTRTQVVLVFTALIFGPYILLTAICYIPCFLKNCFSDTKYLSTKDFISEEDKQKQIKESEEKIDKLKKEKEEFVTNKDKYIEEYEKEKESLEEENKEIDKQNEENSAKVQELQKVVEDMIDSHPEYSVMKQYDEIDFEIVDDAMASGGLTIDEIESYRVKVRQQLEQYIKEQEEKLRQLEEAKKQEAFRQEIRNRLSSMEEEKRRLRYETEAFAAAATQQLQYATQQTYALTAAVNNLNSTANRIADNGEMANVYAQNMYNRWK